MKLEHIAAALIIASIGFGIWAWETANQRDFDVTFSASGEEMMKWAEQAKEDRWVEIVEMKRIDGKLEYVPIPDDEIDAYVGSNDSVLVRRWLEGDAGANLLAGLAAHGYPDAAGAAAEAADDAAGQRSGVYFLAFLSIVCAFGAAATVLAVKRRRQAS